MRLVTFWVTGTQFPTRIGIFLFAITSEWLRAHSDSCVWMLTAISHRIRRLERKADLNRSYSVSTSGPPSALGHRDDFYLPLLGSVGPLNSLSVNTLCLSPTNNIIKTSTTRHWRTSIHYTHACTIRTIRHILSGGSNQGRWNGWDT
jgi:hypothetical protein